MKGRFLAVLALVLAVSASACGTKKQLLAPRIMTVFVRPDAAANDGRVFFMVVKEVDASQLSADTYSEIEKIVLEDDPGPEILGVFSLIPGQERQIYLKKPGYRPAGFYFLFTDPEDRQWKLLLPQPIGLKYNLKITKDKASINRRMSSW